ncbi:hypothetical protein TSAR_015457 [Trichomalopsis sarcophagae]|uniref:Uncharacterized protein n=1 Tax=Trichomalopsis sarcophagae TaxID=543379 RepID=A0A232EER1_9HYME|nr:hypothetical protein TSAR_015457 [Trichomalopsis sarcophagae]
MFSMAIRQVRANFGPYRKGTANSEALQHFTFGLRFPLDYQVRSNHPIPLGEAIRLAIEYEVIYNLHVKEKGFCNYCGRIGHTVDFCRSKKYQLNNGRNNNNPNTNNGGRNDNNNQNGRFNNGNRRPNNHNNYGNQDNEGDNRNNNKNNGYIDRNSDFTNNNAPCYEGNNNNANNIDGPNDRRPKEQYKNNHLN